MSWLVNIFIFVCNKNIIFLFHGVSTVILLGNCSEITFFNIINIYFNCILIYFYVGIKSQNSQISDIRQKNSAHDSRRGDDFRPKASDPKRNLMNSSSSRENIKPRSGDIKPRSDVKPKHSPPADIRPRQFPPPDVRRREPPSTIKKKPSIGNKREYFVLNNLYFRLIKKPSG